MIANWAVPFTLTTPLGVIVFNEEDDGVKRVLVPQACKVGPSGVRLTKSNVPQAFGSLLHRRFLPGIDMTLAVQFWRDETSMLCSDEEIQARLDELLGHVRALLNAGDNEGRIVWVTHGEGARMLDDIRCLAYPSVDVAEDGILTVSFQVDTQYPYGMNLTQLSEGFASGVPEDIENAGNAVFDPVILVHGPTDQFTITNTTTGIQFVYGIDGPGQTIPSGQYAELDCFRNTIFLNGDEDDLDGSVDWLQSDYPYLAIGGNSLTITGASMDVLYQPAWA